MGTHCKACDTNSLRGAGMEAEWCSNALCPTNVGLDSVELR